MSASLSIEARGVTKIFGGGTTPSRLTASFDRPDEGEILPGAARVEND
ncbi:MAG: hypothetical protein ACTSQ7_11390 [Alphaproteobacteria bacterium]